MKKISSFTTALFLILSSFTTQAQSKAVTITGKVISFEESFALEGVSITIKGTNKNSGTQADGTFSIGIAPEDKILVFSLTGYQTQELVIKENRDYEVILTRNGSGDVSGIIKGENNISTSFCKYNFQKE